MKIDELINKLTLLKNKVGGDKEIVGVCVDGESDIYSFDYPIAGDFEDCDGNEYNAAFMISMSGDEFTRKGIPHYKWKCYEDEVKE